MEIVLDRNPFPSQVSDLLKELCRKVTIDKAVQP